MGGFEEVLRVRAKGALAAARTVAGSYGSSVYVCNGLKGGLLVVNAFFAARVLGLKGYGVVVTLLAVAGLLQAFVETRNSEAFVIFSTRYPNDRGRIARVAILTDIISAGIFLLTAFVVANWGWRLGASDFLPQGVDNSIVAAVSVYGACQLLKGTITGVFIREDALHRLALLGVAEEGLKAAGLLILYLQFLTTPFAYAAVVAASAVVVLAVAARVALNIVAHTNNRDRSSSEFGEFTVVNYIRFNAKAFVSTSLKAFHSRMDIVFMSLGFGAAGAGALDLIKRIVLPLSFMMAPVANLTLKRSILISESKTDLLAQMWKYNSRSWLIAGIYFAIAAFILVTIFAARGATHDPWLVVSIIILFTTCTAYTMWWARNFSNLTSQFYSIGGNAIAAIYMSTIAYKAAIGGSILLYTVSLAGLSVGLALYWMAVLKYEESSPGRRSDVGTES